MNNIVNKAESGLQYFLQNPYFMAILKLTLALYAVKIAPNPPQFLDNIFQNTFFKIVALAIIMYLSNVDFQLAIMLAVIYVISMNIASGRQFLESFTDKNVYADYSKEYKPYGNQKLVEPKINVYPGCQNITMQDLLNAFGGDQQKLLETTQYAFKELYQATQSKDVKNKLTSLAYATGLPYNINWEYPETAPYIATLLVNAGFRLNDTCHVPEDGDGEWKGSFGKNVVN
jgi:hypothetical protein